MSGGAMRRLGAIAIGLLALGVWCAPAAQAAAPAWQISLIPMPTNFIPATTGTTSETPLYRVIATNIGGAPASGPVTLTATMPSGITPLQPAGNDGDSSLANPTCAPPIGQEVTCTSGGPVYPGRWLGAIIPLEVTASAGEVLTATASVSGGGAEASTSYEAEINPAPPVFGFLAGPTGLSTLFGKGDGTATSQAGSRSDQLTVNLAFPTEQPPNLPSTSAGHLRTMITDLPEGFVANPTATSERCTEAELVGSGGEESSCPLASQVGMVTIMTELAGPLIVASPIYNMVPPPGAPAELGFEALNVGIYVHLQGGVRSESDFGIRTETDDILARTVNPLLSVQAQIWGDPASSRHDQIRGECRRTGASCPVPISEQTGKAFLRMPSACSPQPLGTTVTAKSWEEPTVPRSRKALSVDTAGNPIGVNGCSALKFEPTLTLQPEANAAESPTGVKIELKVPQHEGKDEAATSNLKDTVVKLPVGMAINPAAAGGRDACTPSQIGAITDVGETPPHFNTNRPECPNSSKIGSVQVETPLLDHPLTGSVYIAQPYQNPFGTLLGVYVVIDDPADGIEVKLAGRTEADPNSGQLTASFTDNPELPVSSFEVNLFGGPRAVLRTPSICGTFTTTSVQVPWSGTDAVDTVNSFKIDQGPNGRPCVSNEAQMPTEPSFAAGTQTPIAGSFSPFLGRLQRQDGTQLLKGLNVTLPPGLTAKVAGVETCSETAIAAASTKSGAEELANPSCPAASQIGDVKVAAGVGPSPYYANGKIYLAGPYSQAPLSAVVITPAVAGPFDLGTVVVRVPSDVDPATAQLEVKSDAFPRILQGIPLQLRDAQVALSRPSLTLNPTNCSEKTIAGEAISVFNQITPLSQRFQVGACKGLDYKPKLAIRLFGGTGRGAHPRLRAILQAKFGEANTARASVALPHSEFLENSHIGSVCTRVQFAVDNCPARAIYGHARAITPLLDEPLEGPVYLRSSSHTLPDMVAALRGPETRPIKVELDGRIDSVNGGIRSTFDLVPDQPVTKFVLNMFGGRRGLIVNSRNLCQHTNKAVAKFDAQNGKVHDFNPVLQNDCKNGKKARHHRAGR